MKTPTNTVIIVSMKSDKNIWALSSKFLDSDYKVEYVCLISFCVAEQLVTFCPCGKGFENISSALSTPTYILLSMPLSIKHTIIFST